MKNNYPIRYVALPLSTNGVWKSYEDSEQGIICYLVIKCYVVGEEITYNREGEAFTRYKVVPTYGSMLPHLFEETNPRYDMNEFEYKEDIKYKNYLYTRNVFDNLEDAEEYRDEKNKDIVDIVVSCAPEWANLKEKFKNTLEKYKSLEELVSKNTEHLPIDDSRMHQQYVYSVDDDNGLIEEEVTVYSLIDEGAYDDESYAVYTITEEEAKELAKIEANDDEANEFTLEDAKKYMHTPLMMHIANYEYAKLISPDNKSEIIALGDTPYISRVPSQKRKVKIDDVGYRELFFTLETYDEIVESYDLNRTRKKSLNLSLKSEDIWTNDRYKY